MNIIKNATKNYFDDIANEQEVTNKRYRVSNIRQEIPNENPDERQGIFGNIFNSINKFCKKIFYLKY